MEEVTFHLRPVYTLPPDHRIKAATKSLLLIQNGFDYYIVRLGEQYEGQRNKTKLSEDMMNMRRECVVDYVFLSNSSLCYIYFNANALVVIHSSEELFQGNLDAKMYNIPLNGVQIAKMGFQDDHLVIATKSDYRSHARMAKAWSVDVPEWSSNIENVVVHECGRKNDVSINAYSTNGRLFITSKYFSDGGISVLDMRDGSEHHFAYNIPHEEKRPICTFHGDNLLIWRCMQSKLQLSIVHISGKTLARVDYSLSLPRIKIQFNGDRWPFHVVMSGACFILQHHRIVLKGYLPSADVQLQEIAMAAAWRGLQYQEQVTLLRKNYFSLREMLLAVIRYEETRKIGKRPLTRSQTKGAERSMLALGD